MSLPQRWAEIWDESPEKQRIYERIIDSSHLPVTAIVSMVSLRMNCLHSMSRRSQQRFGIKPLCIPIQRDSYIYDFLEEKHGNHRINLWEAGSGRLSKIIRTRQLWKAPIENITISFLDYSNHGNVAEVEAFTDQYGPHVIAVTTSVSADLDDIATRLMNYERLWSASYSARETSRLMHVACYRRLSDPIGINRSAETAPDILKVLSEQLAGYAIRIHQARENRYVFGLQGIERFAAPSARLDFASFVTGWRALVLDMEMNAEGHAVEAKVLQLVEKFGGALWTESNAIFHVTVGISAVPCWQVNVPRELKSQAAQLLPRMRFTVGLRGGLLCLSERELFTIQEELGQLPTRSIGSVSTWRRLGRHIG